jgi:hypothetical protein
MESASPDFIEATLSWQDWKAADPATAKKMISPFIIIVLIFKMIVVRKRP